MAPSRDEILRILDGMNLPDGGLLVSHDLIRALSVDDGAFSS